MFNTLYLIHQLFYVTLISFFIIFTIRQLFIKRKNFIFLYHISLLLILFIASIGGGGVQNDDYKRLEKFILLEQNNELEQAKTNPQNYDSMLRIDLQQFKNSREFKEFIKSRDNDVDIAEALFIGWLFALIADISIAMVLVLRYISHKIRQSFLSLIFK